MSPPVTRAKSRHALKDKVAVPYFLRSRVPLGNASNVIGAPGAAAAAAPKRQKAARVKKENAKAKCAAAAAKAPSSGNDEDDDDDGQCETVKQPVTHTDEEAPAAAPHAFSSLLLDTVPDVDSADALDAQMCSEYVRDIYAYLHQLEATMTIKPHYLEGQEVSGAMRAVAVDWLLQVQREFRLQQETFFMSVSIIDRFLQDNPVRKKCFQLVCVTAMLIASKYEEIYPPTAGDFAFVTDGAYTCGDIRRMERIVLKRLNYSLGRPGPLHFLQRACKVGQRGCDLGSSPGVSQVEPCINFPSCRWTSGASVGPGAGHIPPGAGGAGLPAHPRSSVPRGSGGVCGGAPDSGLWRLGRQSAASHRLRPGRFSSGGAGCRPHAADRHRGGRVA